MKPFPVLNTPRLLLGELHKRDIPQIVLFAGDRKIADTTLNIPHPYREKDARDWIKKSRKGFENGNQYTFAIRRKTEQNLIGSIGLIIDRRHNRGSLGYWIATPYWGRGIATEATKAILQFGFQTISLHKIFAIHLVENPASGKVMIKNGMIREGEIKEHYKKDEKYRSVIQYRLTKSEFDQIYPQIAIEHTPHGNTDHK